MGRQSQVAVNGNMPGAKPGEYLPISRRWAAEQMIHLDGDDTTCLQANPRVADDTGRVAVQRGPLVDRLEELDQPRGVETQHGSAGIGAKGLQPEFQSEMKSDLLGGVLLLRHEGVSYERNASANMLYPRYTVCCRPDHESSADIHSVLRMGEPRADPNAGLDSSAQVLRRRTSIAAWRLMSSRKY